MSLTQPQCTPVKVSYIIVIFCLKKATLMTILFSLRDQHYNRQIDKATYIIDHQSLEN